MSLARGIHLVTQAALGSVIFFPRSRDVCGSVCGRREKFHSDDDALQSFRLVAIFARKFLCPATTNQGRFVELRHQRKCAPLSLLAWLVISLLLYRLVVSFSCQTNDSTTTDNSSSWNILRDDFMMGAKMKDWNREEQQTKRKDKKVTNITDYELETSHADIFDESDEGDNEESDSNSDEG